MADEHGSAGARLGARGLRYSKHEHHSQCLMRRKYLLDIGRTMTRRAVMDDLGHVVDMRMDTMPALAAGKLQICEHTKQHNPMKGHLVGRRRGRRHEP